MKRAIIIGAGPSGLACAIRLRKNNIDVTVLEKNETCCKKLLLTGNGRCNIGNKDQDIRHYHSTSDSLLERLLEDKDKYLEEFYNDLGVLLKDKNGYLYPNSNQAKTVCDALINKSKEMGVRILNNQNVTGVSKVDGIFKVKTDDNHYESEYLIIATGGLTVSKTGSTGDGYKFAKEFNHNIRKLSPGLVQIECDGYYLKDWAGIRTDAAVKLYIDDKLTKVEVGEIQLTNDGISGIVTMQISSLFNYYESNNKKIFINFLPMFEDMHELRQYLFRQDNLSIKQLLHNMLNSKLANIILDYTHINSSLKINEIKNLDALLNNLINFEVKPIRTKNYDYAQITVGGVSLEELNRNFESKLVNNLYFIGEVVDINGDCGGYNLSICFISALKAGESC